MNSPGAHRKLHSGEIAIIKGESLRRENLQKPDDFAFEQDGCGQNGTDSKSAAACNIHTGIGFRVVTP